MKVLLIRPDRLQIHLDSRNHRDRLGDLHQPIGLLYLGAMLEREKIDVAICDEIVDDDLFSMIDRHKPDIVGITVTSPMLGRAAKITAYAKDRGCRVILGGSHISALPLESLKESNADIAVIGEGEYSLLEICQNKPLAEVKGIAYRNRHHIVLTEPRMLIDDLDILPLPARHLIDFEKYKNDVEFGFPLKKNEIMLRILASRGCPFTCTNCCSHNVFGRKHRIRKAEKVIEEIKEAVSRWNIKSFTFIDDDFTLNKDYLHEICELIIKERLDIQWSCYARVGTTQQSLALMKKAGCKMIAYGVESGSPAILKRLNKKIDVSQVISTFTAAQKAGIRTKAFFIIGLPGEDEEEFKKTLDLAGQINPHFLWASIFMPLPGSQLYEDMGGYGKVTLNWERNSFFHTENKVLEKRHKQLLTAFYFRLTYLKTALNMFSLEDIRYYWQMFRVFVAMMFLGRRKPSAV